ncbi:MAG: DEAD/DEAH box helicase family protein [Geminocystis sp.]|nr:DEAD/DEAH box helicase family protein [Geminocystis sp.]
MVEWGVLCSHRRVVRKSRLIYDRGTLILHPPPRGKKWIEFATWDDRIERFRIPGYCYRPLIESLQQEGIEIVDEARAYYPLQIRLFSSKTPFAHQREALAAWKRAGGKGVVVLPTGGGKTFLAHLVIAYVATTTLIVVPTLDLMHQWYGEIKENIKGVEVGLLGGGSQDFTPILIATYHSANIHSVTLGNSYGLLIFDECHHLPTDFFRNIAEDSIAPYRLGLTATPERGDGNHKELERLIGDIVYRRTPKELSGKTLAEYEVVSIKVRLSDEEKQCYHQAIKTRNEFLKKYNISLKGIEGWHLFVKVSSTSIEGRRAMLAHRTAKEIALGTEAKIRVLAELLARHYPDKILIFTHDNATVYLISQRFLIPAITHQTPVKERYEILNAYRQGLYKIVVASHVLNEGIDVPSAKIAIILSGTGSSREYIQRLGRILRRGNHEQKLAILYEIIAENTLEEITSARRKEGLNFSAHTPTFKAAESTPQWRVDD